MSQLETLHTFKKIDCVADRLRKDLCKKNFILLFAYNSTGKTRISMKFKEQGKRINERDTLYYNAFTEDLFSWDNDLANNTERVLKFNSQSRFFKGFADLGMDKRIRNILQDYADFDFNIVFEKSHIFFFSKTSNVKDPNDETKIKISRGEENIFIWCVFLAIVTFVVDDDNEFYKWVKYIFIDDPISSLDENNAVAVAHNLSQIFLNGLCSKRKNEECTKMKHGLCPKKENEQCSLKKQDTLKIVISSHHPLFFNVLGHELKNAKKYFLSKNKSPESYTLKDTEETPIFYHINMLAQLKQASETGEIYPYHFGILRSILEKTASFFGHSKFSDCIPFIKSDPDGSLQSRVINIMNHGKNSLYQPTEMPQEHKELFKKTLEAFLESYKFNNELFSKLAETQERT